MRTVVAVAVLILGVSACGDEPQHEVPPSYVPPQVLSLGKSMLELKPRLQYESPVGFEPKVVVTVDRDGWTSTHRSPDAFDVSRPVPGKDAALVVYAFLIAPETTPNDAMTAIRRRAEEAGAAVAKTGELEITVRGGDGPLVASRDGGIALDAVPDGYARVATSRTDGPLLSVWWVPDIEHGAEAEALASTVSAVTNDGAWPPAGR